MINLPANAGVVRMEVTIFPTSVPLRSRMRQNYSYQFNLFTLGQVFSNNIEALETIESQSGGSLGISFKKKDNVFHTVCGFMSPGDMLGNTVEDTVVFNNKPSRMPSYVDRVDGKYYVDSVGNKLYNDPKDLAKKANQTFIASGSLFVQLKNSLDGIQNIFGSTSSASTPEAATAVGNKIKFYNSIVPGASTIRLPSPATEDSNSSTGSNTTPSTIAMSEVVDGDPNGQGFLGWAKSHPEIPLLMVPDFYDESLQGLGLTQVKIQQFVGYVGITNTVPGINIRKQMKDAGIVPYFDNNGIKFGNKNTSFSDIVPSISDESPGIHCSFTKATPIFPGEDFTINFKKQATNPIAIVEDTDIQPGVVRWQMRHQYRFIDSGCISNDNNFITSNFAVCPPAFLEKNGKFENKRFISDVANNYYLADQPYVVIEIDGGLENRYFIIIPYKGSVIMVETTSDAEIVDAFRKGALSKYLSADGLAHSRVIHDFGFVGKTLLDLDSFSVNVQHYRGLLQISFDQINKKGSVSRSRYGTKLKGVLGLSNFLDSKALKDKVVSEILPIKLAGSVIVHMGHVKMSFNFSPITYPSQATINLSYPTGIVNLNGDASAVNILLRTMGGFEEGEVPSSRRTKNTLIKNHLGIVPGQSSCFYSQASSSMFEIVNGVSAKVNYDGFSLNQLLSITGPVSSDAAWGSSYGSYSKKSSIITSFELTDTKEFVNRVHPVVTLTSGDILFKEGDVTWRLVGATRPVCDGFSVYVPEGSRPSWTGIAADVTNNVLSFSDSWSRQDRNFLSHSGNISFYLDKAEALPILEQITAIQTSKGTLFGGTTRVAKDIDSASLSMWGTQNGDQTPFLASLQDKYFYLEIRAWRDPVKTRTYGVGLSDQSATYNAGSGDDIFYGTYKNAIPDKNNTLLFTGFCKKSSYSIDAGKVEMSCTLSDYWEILDSMSWLNAPFYDAMRDYDAVFDVLMRAGFFYERTDRDPGYLINKYVSTPSDNLYYTIPYDNSEVIANDYVLPGSYNTMNQPTFKPGTDEKYSIILRKFAAISGKTIFFDRRGVLHFDVPVDEMELSQLSGSSPNKPLYRAPVFDIFSHTYSSPQGKLVKWWNIIIDGYNFERRVEDIVNEIRIASSTPDGSLVSGAHMNTASFNDIDLPGFIGFRKMFLQKSGYFGSGEAVKKQLQRYTTMFNAPIVAKFNVLGRVGIDVGSTILVDGPGYSEAYRLLVTSTNSTINPGDNSWTTSVEGRYFLPGEKISFTGTTLTLGAGA